MKQIPLTRGKFALVDDEDYVWLSHWKWNFGGDGYARRTETINGKRVCIYMHREINKTPINVRADHKDMNKLNNQRFNLRNATPSQNGMNRSLNKNSISGYKGVAWYRPYNKWRAKIKVGQKSIHIGYFDLDKKTEAAMAYNTAASVYHGKFAKLNIIIA